MSLTVNSRPATWAGTSGPIIYKMTTTDHANAGYYLLVEIWNSTTGLKIGSQKCYPNQGGVLSVRVEAILRSNMSLDNNSDLTSLASVYLDGNWIKYYIKYNQYWPGSSPALIDDSANIRYAIYGGLQIGVINDFADYVLDFKFLTAQKNFTGIFNYPFIFSFIVSATSILRIRRLLSGVELDKVDAFVSIGAGIGKHIETGSADSIEVYLMYPVLLSISSGTNQGSGISWSTGANPNVILGIAQTSKYLAIPYSFPANTTLYIQYDFDISSGPLWEMKIVLLDSSFVAITSVILTDGIGTGNRQGIVDITSVSNGSYISFELEDGAVGVTADINSCCVFESSSSEIKTVSIIGECSNTINLQWRNSLGGVECYPFIYNQEYTFDYGGGKKAKRVTMTALGLSLDQWEAIDGLNTIGEAYKTPITELTTSLNRTMATIGQSVYVLNSDGTKIGVTVINVQNTTQTKQVRHQATVTIEYPELFLQ